MTVSNLYAVGCNCCEHNAELLCENPGLCYLFGIFDTTDGSGAWSREGSNYWLDGEGDRFCSHDVSVARLINYSFEDDNGVPSTLYFYQFQCCEPFDTSPPSEEELAAGLPSPAYGEDSVQLIRHTCPVCVGGGGCVYRFIGETVEDNRWELVSEDCSSNLQCMPGAAYSALSVFTLVQNPTLYTYGVYQTTALTESEYQQWRETGEIYRHTCCGCSVYPPVQVTFGGQFYEPVVADQKMLCPYVYLPAEFANEGTIGYCCDEEYHVECLSVAACGNFPATYSNVNQHAKRAWHGAGYYRGDFYRTGQGTFYSDQRCPCFLEELPEGAYTFWIPPIGGTHVTTCAPGSTTTLVPGPIGAAVCFPVPEVNTPIPVCNACSDDYEPPPDPDPPPDPPPECAGTCCCEDDPPIVCVQFSCKGCQVADATGACPHQDSGFSQPVGCSIWDWTNVDGSCIQLEAGTYNEDNNTTVYEACEEIGQISLIPCCIGYHCADIAGYTEYGTAKVRVRVVAQCSPIAADPEEGTEEGVRWTVLVTTQLFEVVIVQGTCGNFCGGYCMGLQTEETSSCDDIVNLAYAESFYTTTRDCTATDITIIKSNLANCNPGVDRLCSIRLLTSETSGL